MPSFFVITLKGAITPVITGVICDHAVITKYFYWGHAVIMPIATVEWALRLTRVDKSHVVLCLLHPLHSEIQANFPLDLPIHEDWAS